LQNQNQKEKEQLEKRKQMWRLLKTKLNNFNFSKHKDSEKKDEPCPYEEFIKEQEEVLKDNDRKQKVRS
jgi:hypothetical protein